MAPHGLRQQLAKAQVLVDFPSPSSVLCVPQSPNSGDSQNRQVCWVRKSLCWQVSDTATPRGAGRCLKLGAWTRREAAISVDSGDTEARGGHPTKLSGGHPYKNHDKLGQVSCGHAAIALALGRHWCIEFICPKSGEATLLCAAAQPREPSPMQQDLRFILLSKSSLLLSRNPSHNGLEFLAAAGGVQCDG